MLKDSEERARKEEDRAIAAWLSPLNFLIKQQDIISSRTDGTGEWLLRSPEFVNWIAGNEKALWCHGMRELQHLSRLSVLTPRSRRREDNLRVSSLTLVLLYPNLNLSLDLQSSTIFKRLALMTTSGLLLSIVITRSAKSKVT